MLLGGLKTGFKLMIIHATSDIHSPENLQLFLAALGAVKSTPEVFLLAGDLVYKNKVTEFMPVYETLRKKFPKARIIAVFGNEEYKGYEKLYETLYSGVTWLNDSFVEVGNKELCIVGTRGALDKPTNWQLRNMPGIERYYRELPYRIASICENLRKAGCRKIILLTHYGVTDKNLIGEKPEIHPYLACTAFGKILRKELVDIVVHGHVHHGLIEVVEVNRVPIYNVALPARRKIVELEI